jgi:hypothetical protein
MLRVLTLALTTAASANTLSDADLQGFDAFDMKARVVLRDIVDTQRGDRASPANQCLGALFDNLEHVTEEIKIVEVLAGLEPAMVSPADDTKVTIELRARVEDFLRSLALERKLINQHITYCPSIGVITAKGQEILRLYDEVGALVGAIGKKLGR